MLSARGLSKSYGPFKAVDSVDLDIHERDIHVFIGPNGAGKSTVLNMLGGQILPSAGEVFFRGRPLGATTPSWRARAGIGRSFQLTSIVPGFTCLENVVLAVQAHRGLLGLLRLNWKSGEQDQPVKRLAHRFEDCWRDLGLNLDGAKGRNLPRSRGTHTCPLQRDGGRVLAVCH